MGDHGPAKINNIRKDNVNEDRHLPQMMVDPNTGEKVYTQKEISKVWRDTYTRAKWTPTEKEIIVRKKQIEREVAAWTTNQQEKGWGGARPHTERNQKGFWRHETGGIPRHIETHEHAIIGAWDAKNAFPTLADRVDWKLHEGGITGKLWRLARALEEGLKSTIDINGHNIELRKHEHGVSQGAVSTPHRWKYLMSEWPKYCGDRGWGITVTPGKPKVPGLMYVDDATMLAANVEQMITMKKVRGPYAKKWGIQWKPSKDQHLIRGKITKEDVQKLEKAGIKGEDTIKLLKGMQGGPDIFRSLFVSLVESQVVSKLVITPITETEW